VSGDRTPLTLQVYEADIAIDRCDTCRGIWLDDGELERRRTDQL